MTEAMFDLLRVIVAVLAAVELALSGLLVRIHLGRGGRDVLERTCGGGEGYDCEGVLHSRWSVVEWLPPRPVPLAALGLAHFTFLFTWVLFIGRLPGEWHHLWAIPSAIALAGAVGSARFIHVMGYKLRAWCNLCLAVHATNFVLAPALATLWWAGGTEPAAPGAWKVPVLVMLAGAGLAMAIVRHVQTRDAARLLEKVYRRLDNLSVQHFRVEPPVRVPIDERDPVRGRDDAPHTAVIFADFQCSSCAEAGEAIEFLHERLRDRLRIVYKHFPLSTACNPARRGMEEHDHKHACAAAAAAEAARQLGGDEAFWWMHDLLYANQRHLGREPYEQFARQIGLDVEAFGRLRRSGEVMQAICEDTRVGASLGVTATPTIYLDGRRLENPVIHRDTRILKDQTLEHWRQLLELLEQPWRGRSDGYGSMHSQAGQDPQHGIISRTREWPRREPNHSTHM